MAPMGAQSQSVAGSSLPNFRIPALALLALFASLQIADAWLTAVGIDRFGMAAEANPLLALPMSLVGPIAALTIAKVLSVGGAVALYRLSRHGLLAVLTLMYMFVAIAPWTWALVSS
jgi:hypothetical protein